jgi:hypothetical protein
VPKLSERSGAPGNPSIRPIVAVNQALQETLQATCATREQDAIHRGRSAAPPQGSGITFC